MVKSPPRTFMEVFISLPEGTLAQLIENQFIMTVAPRYKHQRIANDIIVKLSNFVNQNHLGEVLDAPFNVYLDDKNAFQPGILFISNENKGIIYDEGLHGAPDLVIEILSKSTAKYDLKDKNIFMNDRESGNIGSFIPRVKRPKVISWRMVYLENQLLEKEASPPDCWIMKCPFN